MGEVSVLPNERIRGAAAPQCTWRDKSHMTNPIWIHEAQSSCISISPNTIVSTSALIKVKVDEPSTAEERHSSAASYVAETRAPRIMVTKR